MTAARRQLIAPRIFGVAEATARFNVYFASVLADLSVMAVGPILPDMPCLRNGA